MCNILYSSGLFVCLEGQKKLLGCGLLGGISTQADIMPLPGKFPIISEYSHKTFFLESVFVKSGILVCRPVILEKKVQFFKVFFFGIFEILEHLFFSEHFQTSICSGGFSPIVGCSSIKRELHNIHFLTFSKVSSGAVSKNSDENICDEV